MVRVITTFISVLAAALVWFPFFVSIPVAVQSFLGPILLFFSGNFFIHSHTRFALVERIPSCILHFLYLVFHMTVGHLKLEHVDIFSYFDVLKSAIIRFRVSLLQSGRIRPGLQWLMTRVQYSVRVICVFPFIIFQYKGRHFLLNAPIFIIRSLNSSFHGILNFITSE
jgi:hypothetical protein